VLFYVSYGFQDTLGQGKHPSLINRKKRNKKSEEDPPKVLQRNCLEIFIQLSEYTSDCKGRELLESHFYIF